jgi:phosphate starvation-inducible protein PhoH and related proteins
VNRKKKLDITPRPIQSPIFKPISQEQSDAYNLCNKNDIVFITGPAGCSKTYTAIAYAVDHVLRHDERRLLLTRPAVEACGEELGALPGGVAEKMQPFLHPLTDTIREYAKDVKVHYEVVAMAHLRGRTLKDTVLVVDEAQNANLRQLKLLLTRIGNGSKILLCGDGDQADIRDSGLMRAAGALQGINGIAHFNFSEIAAGIRHPLIPKILKALEFA